MEKVFISGVEYEIHPLKNTIGSITYKGSECPLCFEITGYYIEHNGKKIRVTV